MTEIQRVVANKWAHLIRGLNAKIIKPEDNFFDLGGHSLLGQQMLLDLRKDIGTDVSINALYEYKSLDRFSKHVETCSSRIDFRDGDANEINEGQSHLYAQSLDELMERLPDSFGPAHIELFQEFDETIVFLTGATDFLGAYIIKEVLSRSSRAVRLIAHVRSVKDPQIAFERLRRSLQGYGLWQDDWSTRLKCVVGDLSQPQLGVEEQTWHQLCQ